MRHCWRARIARFVVLGLVAYGLLVRADSLADDAADNFTPVAPASAIHAALQSNLKIVDDWLKDKDYSSAAGSTDQVLALVQLLGYQGTQPVFQEKMKALTEAVTRLRQSAMDKNDANCKKAMKDCETLLAELAKEPPQGPKGTDKNFKPAGHLKNWMLLMDGTYTDTKSAKNAKEVEELAYALAETINAVQHAKGDKQWREKALAVRAMALEAATKAKAGELEPARQSLKTMVTRCESCHETYKK